MTPPPDYIYVVEPGSAPRRLVAGTWPSWSPDGERLAFNRAGEIHTINADGTGETTIASWGGGPSWSPDGKKIVFVDDSGIKVMNVDGSGITLLLRSDFRDDTYKPWDMGPGNATWSPDGTRIAFHHLGDGDEAPAQIFVMNADGSAVRRASAYDDGIRYAETYPSWSSDGTTLAYWSYRGGLVVNDATGGMPQSIYFKLNLSGRTAWLPDGASRSTGTTIRRPTPARSGSFAPELGRNFTSRTRSIWRSRETRGTGWHS